MPCRFIGSDADIKRVVTGIFKIARRNFFFQLTGTPTLVFAAWPAVAMFSGALTFCFYNIRKEVFKCMGWLQHGNLPADEFFYRFYMFINFRVFKPRIAENNFIDRQATLQHHKEHGRTVLATAKFNDVLHNLTFRRL